MTDSVSGNIEVVLGSASPARRRVLQQAGIDPRVLISDVDEDALLDTLVGAPPREVVVRLAQAKADAVVAAVLGEHTGAAASTESVILTCDSMLLLRGELSGKPHDPEVAVEQWKNMRGQSAELLTGHCVIRIADGEVIASAADTAGTAIDFADITDAEIDAYVATGEPLKVAGAFTLDGLGGWFVDRIDGDPSSVIGISLPLVRRLLTRVGLDVTELWGPTA